MSGHRYDRSVGVRYFGSRFGGPPTASAEVFICSVCGHSNVYAEMNNVPCRPPEVGTSGLFTGYNGTVGPELHGKLGNELLKKASAIERYTDSQIARKKKGEPMDEHHLLTITTMAFDLCQHINWHLEHKKL